jgi:hypothetical protein
MQSLTAGGSICQNMIKTVLKLYIGSFGRISRAWAQIPCACHAGKPDSEGNHQA